MREFIIYSRTGHTSGQFRDLREAGRLDLVQRCIFNALYTSYSLRKDVIFSSVLNGPPSPPKELRVIAAELDEAPTDEKSWESLIKNALNGKSHKGIYVSKKSLQEVVKGRENIFVLNEKGDDIRTADIGEDPVFVVGDQVGLPKKEEEFVLRYGKKISLGTTRAYMSSQVIMAINYVLDPGKM